MFKKDHEANRFWKSLQLALYQSGFSSQAHCFKVLHHVPNQVSCHRRLNSTFFGKKRPKCKSCIVLKWVFDAPRITLLPFSSAPPAIRPTHKDTDHHFPQKINRWKETKPSGTPCFHGVGREQGDFVGVYFALLPFATCTA